MLSKNSKARLQTRGKLLSAVVKRGDWSDMESYMNSNPKLPKFLFTIDGDGVQNGCRGYADIEVEFRRKALVPGIKVLKQLHVPNATNNVIPGKAVAMVWQKAYQQRGKAVHSSIPETGENALMKLVDDPEKHQGSCSGSFRTFELMSRIENSTVQESVGFPADEID